MAKLINLSLRIEVDYIKVCPEWYYAVYNSEKCEHILGEDYIMYKNFKLVIDEDVEDFDVVFKQEVKEIPVCLRMSK